MADRAQSVQAVKSSMTEAVRREATRPEAPGSIRLESARPAAGPLGAQQWEILERIARGGPLPELLLSIVGMVEHQAEGMLCSIHVFDAATQQLRHGAALRLAPELARYIDGSRIGPNVGSCGTAAFRRQRVVVTDIATHPSWQAYKEPFLARGLVACWSTPILSPSGEVLGTLALYFGERRGPTPDECAWVDAATHLAALALSRAESERENSRLLDALEERVRELTLLHRSARLLQAPSRPLGDQLRALLSMIPRGWRFPELCRARIVHGNLDLCTPGYVETPHKQTASAPAGEHPVTLEVVYLREVPAAEHGLFLPEEQTLLDALADLLGVHLEKHAAELALEATLSELRDKNQRLELSITERIRAEEERSRLEAQLRQAHRIQALGTLAGGIAHDFNNILTAISGHTHLGLNDLEEERSPHDSLLAIQEASGRAVELVRRVLMFSRFQHPERRPGPVAPLVQEAAEIARATLAPGVTLELRCDPATPLVSADPAQMRQVLLNLLTNAAYAVGAQGTIEVHVDPVASRGEELSGIPDARHERYARISVRDSGAGMDEATLDRIFEPFFTTKPTGQGTGLGLSIVQGIVKAHEGVIRVHSRPGQGSLFRVYLPAIEPARSAAPEPPIPEGGGARVMYVDDEEPLVVLATRWLGRMGYQVTGFSDSTQALEAFRARPNDFDAVISDFSMPGLSGLDLLREVIAIRKDVVVVMSSGYLRLEDDERAKALGAVDVVLKPQSMSEFGRILHRILSECQARRTPA